MIISEVSMRNFRSFGNNTQVLKLSTDRGELILIAGLNGSGKSVVKETEINVDIPLEDMNLEDINNFLDIMGEESVYIKYIEEENHPLYEKIINYRNSRKDKSK